MARRASNGDAGTLEISLLALLLLAASRDPKAAAMDSGRGHSVLVSLAQMGCPKVHEGFNATSLSKGLHCGGAPRSMEHRLQPKVPAC